MNTSLDATDFRILALLQQDATMSIKAIAAEVGLTSSPTYERINRLREIGVIEKYVVTLNKEKIGFSMTTYCLIRLNVHTMESARTFEEQIVLFDNVIEVVSLSGTFDYMLKVVSKDLKNYQSFVEVALAKLPGIATVQSSFVMKPIKETNAYPLSIFAEMQR